MAERGSDPIGAEEALGESRERLRLIVDHARDHAIFLLDRDGLVVDWRGGAEAVFGYEPDEIIGRKVDMLFLPEDQAAGVPARERAVAAAEGKAADVRWHLRRDGGQVFIDGVATALHDEDGGLAGYLKIGQDVTERHLADRRRAMLMDELQHRVRNTLAVVRSIVRRTAENSDNVEEMAAHLQGRIDAFARVQAVVTRDFERGMSLDVLIADELLAHATGEGERLSIDGPELLLLPRAAEALSLAVHELTTNAVKYGALGVDGGVIRISWTCVGEGGAGRLHFVWEERGREKPLVAVEQSGFGFEFLRRTLPYDFDAESEIEFLDEGLRFILRMPLHGAIAAPAPAPGEGPDAAAPTAIPPSRHVSE